MAVQPMFVPLGEEERVGGWVKVREQGELAEGGGVIKVDKGYL